MISYIWQRFFIVETLICMTGNELFQIYYFFTFNKNFTIIPYNYKTENSIKTELDLSG